jgi:uncharacterized protein (TIGR02246 family)
MWERNVTAVRPPSADGFRWNTNGTFHPAASPSSMMVVRREDVMNLLASTMLAGCAILAGCASPGGGQQAMPAQCKDTNEGEISALFEHWNQSLLSGDPQQVVANYAEKSILLPTVSNKVRLTAAEKNDYFQHFLEKRPSGKVDMRFIDIDCNTAVDAGLYTFTFAKTGEVVHARYTYTYRWNGKKWLITSHHSSAMPEK